MTIKLFIKSGLLILFLTACAPKVYLAGPKVLEGQLLTNRYITPDGEILPVRQWLPQQGKPAAIIIAVHGFNDYSHFFEQAGNFFRDQGIACFAYDQRGFGGSMRRGVWSGTAAYVQDLDLFIQLVKAKNPGIPVYLLGESMGGAVVINAINSTTPLTTKVNGIILSAPAVWDRASMPWYQQALLWSLSHTVPWLTLTGRNLKIMASDNIPMLREMGKDPLVIKETRIEAVHGLADLMDAAAAKATAIDGRVLLIYGEKDQIIPKQPTYQFIQQFLSTKADKKTVALYENGYHMLLRDLQAVHYWQDIAAWIKTPSSPLPSGADKHAKQVLISWSSALTGAC